MSLMPLMAAETHEEVNETLNHWVVGGNCARRSCCSLMLALVVFGGGREHS